MADSRAIGIFDSGLGGLTVVKEIIKKLPNEDIVYFGDTGRVPYGTRSHKVIRKYAAEDERFLLKNDVKIIVAACGTVSSVAADDAERLPVPFFEMVTHAAKSAVKTTKNGIIGVIGTAATIASESHKRKILELMPEAQVVAASCSLFVPLVEEGWYSPDDVVVLETVRRYLKPIIDAGADTLILGCTHYPILERVIAKVTDGKVKLINPGISVAEAVSEHLSESGTAAFGERIGEHRFFVSDRAQSFRYTASILLGEDIDNEKITLVDLNSL